MGPPIVGLFSIPKQSGTTARETLSLVTLHAQLMKRISYSRHFQQLPQRRTLFQTVEARWILMGRLVQYSYSDYHLASTSCFRLECSVCWINAASH